MKGILIAGGVVDVLQLKQYVGECDIIVGVDSGLKNLMEIDVIPDILIGDLDSIDERTTSWYKLNRISVLKYPIEKDKTDTEIALDYLIENKAETIYLFGCTGTRIDHMLSNISLLRFLSLKKIEGIIVDIKNEIQYINNVVFIKRKENEYISIIPISLNGIKLTLEGFHYDLQSEQLEYSTSLGVSNYLIADLGKISIIDGEALLVKSRD